MADTKYVPVKYGEILPPAHREVGVRIGNQVYLPALPMDASMVHAQNGYLQAHNLAVSLLDQYHALREQYAANRSVIYRPAADVAAQAEEEEELKHQRELAKLRREREREEHRLATLQSRHKADAEEEFKLIKFASGVARFAAKTAQHRVGEAVANATLNGGAPKIEREEADKPARPPMVDVLVQGIEDLEKQIEEQEASGIPAQLLNAQRDALRDLLMRELKKGR
jgi:hypothetical protein